jgi:hypothetical protein
MAKTVAKAKSRERKTIRIINSSSQMIPIQLTAEGEDFFRGQQQMQLMPGKDVLIDEMYLINGQVDNLRERGLLKLIRQSDSE